MNFYSELFRVFARFKFLLDSSMLWLGTLFSNIVVKFQQTCPADAGGILEYRPRSFTTFRGNNLIEYSDNLTE